MQGMMIEKFEVVFAWVFAGGLGGLVGFAALVVATWLPTSVGLSVLGWLLKRKINELKALDQRGREELAKRGRSS